MDIDDGQLADLEDLPTSIIVANMEPGVFSNMDLRVSWFFLWPSASGALQSFRNPLILRPRARPSKMIGLPGGILEKCLGFAAANHAEFGNHTLSSKASRASSEVFHSSEKTSRVIHWSFIIVQVADTSFGSRRVRLGKDGNYDGESFLSCWHRRLHSS